MKITYCRWLPPPRVHSFTATTHFKSSRSFVSPCVCCMLCRMRRRKLVGIFEYNAKFLIYKTFFAGLVQNTLLTVSFPIHAKLMSKFVKPPVTVDLSPSSHQAASPLINRVGHIANKSIICVIIIITTHAATSASDRHLNIT